MAISPFKTKYQTMAPYKGAKACELRNLKDGNLVLFHDDGPFPEDTPRWDKIAAKQKRDAFVRALKKREIDPNDPRGEETIPVFVFDGEGPLPKVYDKDIGQFISPQRMNDQHRKAMEAFKARRNSIEMQAKQQIEARKAEHEAKASAGVEQVLAALGERMGKAKGKGARDAE